MNIAIFTDTYFPDINGVASSIYTMTNGLRAKGHRVFIFSISEPSKQIKLISLNPPVYRIPSLPIAGLKPYRAVLPHYTRLIELIKKLEIDIIHTHTEFSMGLMGSVVAFAIGAPHIHTYHTMLEDYTHYIAGGKLKLEGFARKYSGVYCDAMDALIVPTEKVKNAVLSYGAEDVPIHVIPSGINLKPFAPENYSRQEIDAIKLAFGIKFTDKVLLSIGRVAHEKSLDVAIKALPNALAKNPNIKLVIIGNGPALEDLMALARELKVYDNVIFAGAVPFAEVGKYYQVGDAFISCSTSETQGLTYYEALAAGLPVLARYDDCILETLFDGVNAMLFEKEEELPSKMLKILEDDMRDTLSANARASVKEFDAELFADRIEAAYIATYNAHLVSKIDRDQNPAVKLAHKTRDKINTTMTKTITGTDKMIVPVVRKSKNISRKIRHGAHDVKDTITSKAEAIYSAFSGDETGAETEVHDLSDTTSDTNDATSDVDSSK